MAGNSTNPATPSNDPRSQQAPGVRTEAEVKAAEEAARAAAANAAPPGATGNPATPPTTVKGDPDKLVHYERKSDGTVQSVNEGSAEHRVLERGADWRKVSRAKAKDFKPRTFVRTAKAKA